VRSSRPPWEFGYAPATRYPFVFGEVPGELIVATARSVPGEALRAALSGPFPDALVVAVLDRAPLHWFELKLSRAVVVAEVEQHLRDAGIPVRYVAAVRCPDARSFHLACADAAPCLARDWGPPTPRELRPPEGAGAYFLGEGPGGLVIERALVGSGAGTRLAVIDDDGADAEGLGLDAEVWVRVDRAPRGHFHGALMVAWATSAAASGFAGVAPDASTRLYLIPKGGDELLSLPLALVRAADDGADVILCPTHVDGLTSPMLSDALTFVTELGRRGLGAAIVMPTGRDASSPEGSARVSWSLGWGAPASDPRVFCVGPSGRTGGWFLWRDASGKLRPFANRSPSVRWLAPGDDLALPFGPRGRTVHAESSGASALAAGVALLVLGRSPELPLALLAQAMDRGARPTPPLRAEDSETLGAASDLWPTGRDADGHDAKQGYGVLDARRSCLVLHDPLSAALLAMGEEASARGVALALDELVAPLPELLRWAAARCLADPRLEHAVRAIARHLRLVTRAAQRHEAHGVGSLARQLVVVIDWLARTAPVAERAWAETLVRAALPLHEALGRGEASVRAIEGAILAWFAAASAPSEGATVVT
jgi:hypothetical protein